MLWKPSLLKVLRDRESQLWVDLDMRLPSIPLQGTRTGRWQQVQLSVRCHREKPGAQAHLTRCNGWVS